MNTSFKTNFFLKKSGSYKSGPLSIYVRITVDGERCELTVQRKMDPSRWNQTTGRAKGSKSETIQLNTYLDAIQGKIFEIQKEHELKNEPLTSEIVKQKLLGITKEKQHTLIEIFTYHNQQFGALVGKEYSLGTFKKFKCVLTSIKNFLQWKYQKKDIIITDLNHQFITEYEFYLKTVQNVQHNSAMANIKKLKKIVNQCLANGWLEKDPFFAYKIKLKETHKVILSEDELNLLQNKSFEISRLDQVKDCFLFSCFTGLSYSDLMKLKTEDLVKGIDGEIWIFTTRTKTDTPSRIPLLPGALAIIEKYKDNPSVKNKGKVLPTLSNQKMNSYLKEITDSCGFKKDLTFHSARHTFATTVTLSNGVPIETVSKMLGHRSLTTTQHYAKILDKKVSDDMSALRIKYKNIVEGSEKNQLSNKK